MRGGVLARLAALLLLCLLGASPADAGSRGGAAVATCVARAAAFAASADAFRHPDRFDCRTPQVAFGSGDYWVLSQPLPAAAGIDHPLRVRTASVWQEAMTLYARYADGSVAVVTIDGHAATRRLQLGAIIETMLPQRPVPVVRLLWRVHGAANLRGIVSDLHVGSGVDSRDADVLMATIYAGFAGLCIALLCYNLALWAALRHRFQIAYCAMLAMLLLYAFSSSGALAWAMPWIANNDRMRVNYAALGLSGAAALAFARMFFERAVFAGWRGRAASAAMAAVLGSALAYVVLAPWHIQLLDRLFAGSFVMMTLLALPVLWRAWRLRSNFLWAFAVAWAAPIAFAALRAAGNFHLVPWSFWLDNSTVFAMSAEALLSSLAIAYRMRLLSRERDEARSKEIAAQLLADTDPLTGLLNRRAFLRQAIGRAGEQTLLVADLDHFKAINETIGHDGGDEVLRLFARTLSSALPADGLLARIGGEEFAIIVARGTAPDPETILANLRAARMPFDLAVTASIGTCSGALDTEADWKHLYRHADRALYEAKAAGRDRSRVSLALAA